jgi:hypothetical protein
MENSIINALAFLRVSQHSKSNDYLDNFIPFVAKCLQIQKDKNIDPIKLQILIYNEFRINIPLHVIKSLLYRSSKKGYVSKVNHNYIKNEDKLNELNFDKTNANVQRIYNALINTFIEYSQKNHSLDLSDVEAEKLLISFINYNHSKIFFATPDSHQFNPCQNLNYKEKFIVSEFFTHIIKTDPVLYNYIEIIITGYMIVNALYLPDIFNINKNFKGTQFYFDTSFIIYALGYNDNEMKIPCLELLDLLYSYGAELYCFNHTLQEIEGILYACSNRLTQVNTSIFGRSIYFFLSHGYKKDDVLLLISKLKRNIEDLRIRVVDKPDFKQHNYMISEIDLSDILSEKISARPEAIEKDVASISAVYRIRRDELSSRIEDSKAIFVTTNTTLSNVVSEFHDQKFDSHSISPCITDYLLTTLLWLKSPTKAPDLPMKRLIADCYAAIQPDDIFLEKWFSEINKIKEDPILSTGISEDDYTFLRYSGIVQNVLMETTYGILEEINSSSVIDILDRTKKRILSDSEGKIDKLLTTQSEISTENNILNNKINQLKKQYNLEQSKIDTRLKRKSDDFSQKCMKVIKLAVYAILICSIIITFPFDDCNINIGIDNFSQPLVSGAFILLTIITIADTILGWQVQTVFQKLELIISMKRYHYLKSIINE